jgi:DNA-binding transcriptional MocR family regulator
MKTKEQAQTGKTFLHEEVATKIGDMIRQGTYRPNDRIPSIRNLSRQMRVSVNTVMEAYANLENIGLIEARPQSGYYVSVPHPEPAGRPLLKPSLEYTSPNKVILGETPLQIIQTITNPTLIPLGTGAPNTDLLPADKLNRILASQTKRYANKSVAYSSSQGMKKLRIQIARRMLNSGCSLSADDIIITSGCVEAVTLALLTTCKPGDTVALGSPIYYTFLNSVQWLGLKVLEIPSVPGKGLSLDVLDYAMKQTKISACIIIADFNNPLGTLMSDETKQNLVKLLTNHDIPIIEDDVYGDLAFNNFRPTSVKAFDEKGIVLSCSSFSKTLAPGYRIGWIVPGIFQQRVEQLKTLFNIATASPTQLAVAEFLTNGGYDHHLRKIRRIYARQMNLMRDVVISNFPRGTRVNHPEGGYILWVEMPAGCDSLRLYEEGLKKGIGIAPGILFSTNNKYKNCFRLNAAFWSAQVENALETLGRIAESMVKI